VDRIILAQDKDQCQAPVNTIFYFLDRVVCTESARWDGRIL
jgi:hypothetical protein